MENPGESAQGFDDVQAPLGVPLAAAGGGALVGAIGWAMLLKQAGYEIGWIAWGIGGLVGWAAVRAGGRGRMLAVGAAVLTVFSIFAGKLLGYHLELDASVAAMADEDLQAYGEYQRDAADWATLCANGQPPPEAVRSFMGAHDYIDPDQGPLEDDEVDSFLALVAPRLSWMHAEQPSPAQFRARVAADLSAMVYAEASLPELVIADLNLYDALFAFLGITTAFGLVMRGDGGRSRPKEAEPRS